MVIYHDRKWKITLSFKQTQGISFPKKAAGQKYVNLPSGFPRKSGDY